MTRMEENNNQFEERLVKYPEIRGRMEEILGIIENTKGDANTADEAEERAVEEVRKLGQEMLGAWAKEKEAKLEEEYGGRKEYRQKEKKSLLGKPLRKNRSG